MSLLAVQGLRAGYRGVPVVADLSLVVEQGEIVALLGSNGAGKTTSLLTLAGLLPAIGGRIEFNGHPILGRRPDSIARAGLVLVPEDRALFSSLTVRENIRLAARSRSDVDAAYGYFPALERLANRHAGVLSGGEQQMLALARAIARSPRLLVVDEMSLGLAPLIVKGLVPVLRRFVADTGASVLLVEQHVHLALEVAQRAYIMSRGAIIREGTAVEIAESMSGLRGSYFGVEPTV